MKITHLEQPGTGTYLPLPLFNASVPAGFPSAADDYIEKVLDLNEYLIKHPSATYLVRADGDSMVGRGILDKAILVVDRSREPKQDNIVIAAINGELTCKILDLKNRCLLAANPAYTPVPINSDMDFVIEGVVIHAINPLCTP